MTRAESLRMLESEVGVLIRRVRRVIGERARAVHPDLQAGSYLILSTVAQNGSMRASELAEQFDMDKGAISRQVKQLVGLGLLAHTRDPADGRAQRLTATVTALDRLEQVVEQRHRWVDEQLSGWTLDELDSFVGDLARYNAALNQITVPS
ncbi:MAG: MarR family transcriptional regulator [Nocardioides sp.]